MLSIFNEFKNNNRELKKNNISLNIERLGVSAATMIDIYRSMFGFDEKYSLGHDIFDDKENIVVFPNGNVLTDKVYYSEVNDEYITFTNDAIDSDYISKIKDYANQLLEVSNGIIKYDLIDKIGKDVGKCEKK